LLSVVSRYSKADRIGLLRERLATRWLLVMALATGRTPVRTCIQECEAPAETLDSEHPGGAGTAAAPVLILPMAA